MSDDKLKSKDEKPTSRKSRPSTTRITAATKTPNRTTAPERNTAKVKSTSTPKKQPVTVKKSEPNSKITPTNPKPITTNQKSTDKTVANTAQEKASEKVLMDTNTITPQKKGVAEKDVANLNPIKDKKPLEPSTKAKIESEPISRPRKNKSITKMASVAAILFLGVLVVFLLGRDPASVEGQTASTTPSTTAALPNPNASSPYGMRVEQLKEIEVLLAVLNFDPGNIDGDIDHETVTAISLFQQISGIEVDGRPSPALLIELKAVDELLNK